ncbi:MAG: hypothetical protein ACQESC_04820 [Nanobdellota archaeon]
MSRFLTSVQVIASLASTLLLLIGLNSDTMIANLDPFIVAGYIGVIGGAFLFTVNLMTSKFSSKPFSGKVSMLLLIFYIISSAVVLESSIASFLESFLSEPLKIVVYVHVVVFVFSLFFSTSRSRKKNADLDNMMRHSRKR